MLGRGGVLESLLTPRAVQAIQSVRDRLRRSCPRGGAGAGRGPEGADNTQENMKKQTGAARFVSKTLSVLDRDSDDETGYLGSSDIDPTGSRTTAGKRESVSWDTVTGWV